MAANVNQECKRMSLQVQKDRNGKLISGPYKELYVYLLDGVASGSDEEVLGPSFIGNWVEEKNSFLFFGGPSRDKVMALLDKRPDLNLVDEYQLDYEQWQGDVLGPLEIAGFRVVPRWMEIEGLRELAAKDTIVLDPGVVFGNGLHPTTQDCLKALRWVRERCGFGRVLDLGTGTGILAMAAALLGAEKVLAVDINPLCVKTAKENIRLNGLEHVVEVLEGYAQAFVDQPADLVVANLDYDIISQLLKEPPMRQKPWLIFSGLMRTPFRDLSATLEGYGMNIARQWDHDMTWFTIVCRGGC